MNTRGQGGEWGIIRNIFLVIVVILIALYILKVFVVDSIKDQSDCEKLAEQGAHCAIVCGPGEEQIPSMCDKKTHPGEICCQDTEYIFNVTEG